MARCVHGTFGETCEATSDVCDIVEPCTAASTCLSVDGTATCQCPDSKLDPGVYNSVYCV